MDDPKTLARQVYQAYVDKDRELIESLLAEDLRFTSPLDNGIDRETYFETCWPNSETISSFEFIHLVESDGRVFVTYEGTGVEGRRFRNTEILTFREGKLAEVEVYFGWSIPHAARPGGFVDPKVAA